MRPSIGIKRSLLDRILNPAIDWLSRNSPDFWIESAIIFIVAYSILSVMG